MAALRRCFTCTALLVACTLVACQSPTTPAVPGQVGSDLSPDNAIFSLDEFGLRMLWRQELGQSTRAPLHEIYATGDVLVAEAGEGQLHIYDAAKGTWMTGAALPGSLARAPVTWGDRLVLVQHNTVYTFGLDDEQLSHGYEPKFAVFTPPLVFRDGLILAGGDGTIARIQLKETRPEWRVSLQGPIMQQPLLHDGVVYAAAYADKGAAVRADSGTELWQWKPAGPGKLSSGVAVAIKTAYVGDNRGRLYALDSDFGRLKWTKDFEAPIVGKPLVVGDTLLVFSSKPAAIAMPAGGDSEVLWRAEGATRLLTTGQGRAYFLNEGNVISAVSLDTGEQLWREPLPGDCVFAGSERSPVFFVANSSGSIVAFEELKVE